MVMARQVSDGLDDVPIKAFSSEVATGSRKENASKQKHRAPLLIPSEAERL
jgi:hypothetical protein